jgi:hypothetical protein
MRVIGLVLVFAGVVLAVVATYERRMAALRELPPVEYRFVPRTLYDEQGYGGGLQGASYPALFNQPSVWQERAGSG